jgi:membrane protein YqaA with SNARE-associated domain
MLKALYDKLGRQVHSPYATPLLGVLFFIEAIFFVPVDPLLMLYCIENRSRALWYAAVATFASVLGGVAGYYIGFAIWETVGIRLVGLFFSTQQFNYAIEQFRHYEIWAVLIAGFTPLPYKAVTLAAGFCKLPLIPFIICSAIARGARFFLVAIIIQIWGAQIKEFIDRYFNILVVLFTLLVIVAVWWIV